MRVGVDVPYFSDPGATKEYVAAVEELGYHHVGFPEHVVASRKTAYPGSFAYEDPWHESTTYCAFLAGITSRLELNPALLLMTLRHPVLVAKQVAELSLLSAGRIRIAVAGGWNREEQQVLGLEPATRGARLEEAIPLIRRLWAEDTVTFSGRFFAVAEAGIHPRPPAPVPIWMGGGSIGRGGVPSERTLDRIVRLADGFKMLTPVWLNREDAWRLAKLVRERAAKVRPDCRDFGIEARMTIPTDTPNEWASLVTHWKEEGATHLGVALGRADVDVQIARVTAFAEATRELW